MPYKKVQDININQKITFIILFYVYVQFLKFLMLYTFQRSPVHIEIDGSSHARELIPGKNNELTQIPKRLSLELPQCPRARNIQKRRNLKTDLSNNK
jgi:hypothetical protein